VVTPYRLTPRARSGPLEILEYVEQEFSLRVEEELLDRIEAAFELLADNPGIGHVREEITLDSSVRFWRVGSTLIAYRRAADTLEILFVERCERDWQRIFHEGM
jgi:toxin ParE1/3/4